MAPQTLREIREKQRANAKHYREEHKDDPEFNKKERQRWNRWYHNKKNKQKSGQKISL